MRRILRELLTGSKYRARLPQLDGGVFLTDGGIETVLIFHEGLDLPAFAAFDLLKDRSGTDALRDYYMPYLSLARERGLGFVLESPTWRASPRWAGELGYDGGELDQLNRRAIALMEELRAEHETADMPVVISGCIGPQDDGYQPNALLSAEEARAYHSVQIATLADTAADMVTAMTLTYADEAAGLTRAAVEHSMPVVIGFTLETDGRLPSGQPLGEAIEQVDGETGGAPEYYMLNCAHPTHVASGHERVRALRANASKLSHEELDEAEELDEGDPGELAAGYVGLSSKLPRLSVLGGCCGTDHRHVEAIRDAWLEEPALRR
jgi:S-methylmethionine-dependent homocysteine/selenocysteine methylase